MFGKNVHTDYWKVEPNFSNSITIKKFDWVKLFSARRKISFLGYR